MNTFPYDAVVFDLDGTLFDAEDGITSSVAHAMQQLGYEIPQGADLREVVGPPLRDSFERLLGVPSDHVMRAMELYLAQFKAEGVRRYRVYPHIRSILTMLKEEKVHVGLATSKSRSVAKEILDDFGLSGYFDRIEGEQGREEQLGKAVLIRRALPDRYSRAAMVGDRRFDMHGAKEAGVEAIGAGYGCGSEQELVDAGAAVVVPDTESLRALLCPGGEVPRGVFLTVEGLDGSGKTTQMDMLESGLKQYGFSVVRTREPGGCDISEDIRRIVLDANNMEMCAPCEALLYAAARAQHVHQVIRPAVERGQLVLCDRFVDSSIAYQGGGRELGFEIVRQINALAVAEMIPDATLYLDINHKIALNRRLSASTPDRLEVEDIVFYGRVQEVYERLIREDKKRFLVVDAQRDIESIAVDALNVVLNRLIPDLKREA